MDFLAAVEKAKADELVRPQKQQQARVNAEVSLLDAATDMREYNRRRDAMPYLLAEPDLPLDEMTQSDYNKSRDWQERGRR